MWMRRRQQKRLRGSGLLDRKRVSRVCFLRIRRRRWFKKDVESDLLCYATEICWARWELRFSCWLLQQKVVTDPGNSYFQEVVGSESHSNEFCWRQRDVVKTEDDVGKRDYVTYPPNQDTCLWKGAQFIIMLGYQGYTEWSLLVVVGKRDFPGSICFMSPLCLLSLKQFLIYDLAILSPLVIWLF